MSRLVGSAPGPVGGGFGILDATPETLALFVGFGLVVGRHREPDGVRLYREYERGGRRTDAVPFPLPG